MRPPESERYTLATFEPVAVRRAQIRLFALSAGKFRAGSVAQSPAVLAEGPDLTATARESVLRALSFSNKVKS